MSRFTASSITSWVNQASKFGRDGWNLMRAAWNVSSNNSRTGAAPNLAGGTSTTTSSSSNSNLNMLLSRSSYQPFLVEQAKKSNAVAHSLLRMDKQYGLIQYYGLSEYIRNQRWKSTSSNSSASSATDSSTAATSTSGIASNDANIESKDNNIKAVKIAFMITASMKQELASPALGYTDEQIKRLTPTQASLILNAKLPASEMEQKLPILEQEHEQFVKEQQQQQQQQQQKEEEERQRLQEEQNMTTSSFTDTSFSSTSYKFDPVSKEPTSADVGSSSSSSYSANSLFASSASSKSSSSVSPSSLFNSSSSSSLSSSSTFDSSSSSSASSSQEVSTSFMPYASVNVLKHPEMDNQLPTPANIGSSQDNSDGRVDVVGVDDDDDTIWYQVIEISNTTGERTRMGLYFDEVEAQIGLETRQDIAEREYRVSLDRNNQKLNEEKDNSANNDDDGNDNDHIIKVPTGPNKIVLEPIRKRDL